jgi:pimeloyl-ACP methyl ester carboxylesterase
METVRSKDGTHIAFDRVGHGFPVVLVGGAFSYRTFGKLVQLGKLLADAGFTVVNYDRRGRGDSGDTPPYAVEREIEDLEALIGAVGGEACAWGWSSGGVLAMRAAASGLSIARLAVYEPPFMVEPGEHLPPEDFAPRLQELVDEDRRGDAVRLYMTEGMGVPGAIVTLMRFSPFWSKLKATSPTLPYDTAVLGDTMQGGPLRPDEWSTIRAPTLVLAGEKSPEMLRKGAKAAAAVLPNGSHRLLAGQSHNPNMKKLAPVLAEQFAAARQSTRANRTPNS